jgi:hypothetical protein
MGAPVVALNFGATVICRVPFWGTEPHGAIKMFELGNDCDEYTDAQNDTH